MKAWCCFVDSPEYGSLLVFAESRNIAKNIASHSIFDEWEYKEITAHREKRFDGLRDIRCSIASNDELPDNFKFYSEEYELGEEALNASDLNH